MTFSATIKLFLPVALAVTVAPKWISLRNLHDDSSIGVMKAESLLLSNGYRVVNIDRNSDPVELDAKGPMCDVKMYVVAPLGWHKNLLHEIAGSQRLRFIYDGAEYPDQPGWSTWLYYQWWQINSLVGLRLPAKPVLAIVEPSRCPAIRLTQADDASGRHRPSSLRSVSFHPG